MTVSATARKRLDAQGYDTLDDATYNDVGNWLRWSPMICALGMAAGTALQSPPVLWAFGVTALLGAILPFHPFDLLYNYGVRHVTGTGPLPHHTAQRRFACGLATVWLIATGFAFNAGSITLGHALGWSLTAVAATVGSTNFCIPSLIYNALFKRRPATA